MLPLRTTIISYMERKPVKIRRQGAIARLVNHWTDRLVGAASQGTFAEQEEQYASGQATRDFVFNGIGTGTWGFVFPLLTIVATQCAGTDQAGLFALAFVTGTLLMYIGNYGVRTYQVSDIDEMHSFADYQINRIITCALMMLVGYLYCLLRGYVGEMLAVSMGVYLYRMVDALADVYEGRLQQVDKMYLAGISQALRSIFVFVAFSVVLFVTRSLDFSCIVMAVVALASFLFITLPLAYMETPKSRHWEAKSVMGLFRMCFPLFVALFLYCLVDNMPKFMMEGVLSYDNQLYFNVLYFPAQGILLTAQLVYKPLLLRIAAAWENPDDKRSFRIIMIAVFCVIVVVTIASFAIMAWVGIPLMSWLYGVDFEQFRVLMYLMVVAGGVTAAIDFLYQLITVQRRQRGVAKLYLLTFAFSFVANLALINIIGLTGAVIAYLAQMTFLFVLVTLEFAGIDIRRRKRQAASEGVGQHWG